MSSIEVRIVDGPLGSSRLPPADGAGAVIQFEGVVRPQEGDDSLAALVYEDYQPMTQRALEQLCREIVEAHGLIWIRLEHSRGRVPVGAISFRLCVAAAHRRPAITAMGELIDRMKAEVPLWKVPEWPDGSFGERG